MIVNILYIHLVMNSKFQDVDEEWPLQIYDHDGKLHNVFLKPGEMIWLVIIFVLEISLIMSL